MNHFKLNLEWHRLLIKYFDGLDYIICLISNNSTPYKIRFNNILNSNINISEQWGFLTLEFANKEDKAKFLIQIEMSISIQKLEGPTWLKRITTNYNEKKYPCRVYPASSSFTIAFYDAEKVGDAFSNGTIEINELLAYRKSILETIMMDIQNYINS